MKNISAKIDIEELRRLLNLFGDTGDYDTDSFCGADLFIDFVERIQNEN